jgi:hypothetical protein
MTAGLIVAVAWLATTVVVSALIARLCRSADFEDAHRRRAPEQASATDPTDESIGERPLFR